VKFIHFVHMCEMYKMKNVLKFANIMFQVQRMSVIKKIYNNVNS
jgi:hypothetical protein